MKKTMKKTIKRKSFLILALLGMLALGGCTGEEAGQQQDADPQQDTAGDLSDDTSGSSLDDVMNAQKYYAEIAIQDKGTILVELDGDTAPITVQNFIDLANDGFYDGLTIHRVVNGFVMQGGDPDGNGTGGSKDTIKGEFSENGVENPLSHTRGAISMARSDDMDSASSQFFIVHQDSTFLDGKYACFGYVLNGMEIVDDICENTLVENQETGFVAPENQPVIESIKIIE